MLLSKRPSPSGAMRRGAGSVSRRGWTAGALCCAELCLRCAPSRRCAAPVSYTHLTLPTICSV
eukprot:12647719-Alexandrium_andersonii.AAC.1